MSEAHKAAMEAATFQLCPVACKVYCATCVRKATAAIEAYRAAMREAGFVMVPEVPTEAMVDAYWSGLDDHYPTEENIPKTYAAMLAAAKEGE